MRPRLDAALTNLADLEETLKYPLIAYVLQEGAQIADDVYPGFVDILRALGPHTEVGILIHTNGGVTEVPFKLMTALRAYADKVNVLVPLKAYSAGTHLAMGGDQIIMGCAALLGPVDPIQNHPLLPKDAEGNQIAISVQDLKHCVAFIKREHGSDLNGEAFAQVMTALFAQVHPLAIGAIEQGYALGQLVSRKMLEMHLDSVTDKPRIDALVTQLSDGYCSHSFGIGYKEAQSIGLKAVVASPDVQDLMVGVVVNVLNVEPKPLLPATPRHQHLLGGVVLSRERSMALIQIAAPSANQTNAKMEVVGASWVLLP